MSIHGKRDVVRSLDYLLYCHFAYSYFLDASLLVLLFRLFLQLQLLAPRSLPRSLRTALGIITAGSLICVLMHITAEPGQPGILIDFIGNQQPPSRVRMVVLDLVIYLFQIVRLAISSSLSSQLLLNSAVATVAVPGPLARALGSDRFTLTMPRETEDETSDDLFYQRELVVDIGLRSSVRNIMYADMDEGSSTSASSRNGSAERLPV